jgi:hypothetical protein
VSIGKSHDAGARGRLLDRAVRELNALAGPDEPRDVEVALGRQSHRLDVVAREVITEAEGKIARRDHERAGITAVLKPNDTRHLDGDRKILTFDPRLFAFEVQSRVSRDLTACKIS